ERVCEENENLDFLTGDMQNTGAKAIWYGLLLAYDANYEKADGSTDYQYDTQAYLPGNSAAVLANPFIRSGWRFTGWNTQADGSGDSYAPDSALTMNQSQVLYAQWEQVFSVTYVVEGDPVFGAPADVDAPCDSNAYPLNAPVTVYRTLSTSWTTSDGTPSGIPGVWKFEKWDHVDFNITQDTEIRGSWVFIPSTGDLTVSKTISGNAANPNQSFSFTVTLDRTDINGDYGDLTFTDGAASFTLSAGESVTASGLPAGVSYTVAEKSTAGYIVTVNGVSASSVTGVITANATVAAVFNNHRELTGSSTVTPSRPIKPSDHNPKVPQNSNPSVPGEIEIEDKEILLAAVGLNTIDHVAYIIGYTDGTVRPTQNISRAEVVTVFFRLLTNEYRTENWSTENGYSDVTPEKWFNNAVSTMSSAGVVTGYLDGTFAPDRFITRAEFACIASRFLPDGIEAQSGTFTDIQGHWAEQQIELAAAAGWIVGYNGEFRPDDYITRAEAMTLVNRMLMRAVEEEHMLPDMVHWCDNFSGNWYYEAVQEATNTHDYDRLEKVVPRQHFCFEDWLAILENPDWAALEKEWSNANSAGNVSAGDMEPED
ncbi:MAG: S-layer homology domain-containing protein, partial [Clostridiaceae bacterium]|nr:S-layer homology domain-containing protein [Clostridiaceae bacterium]